MPLVRALLLVLLTGLCTGPVYADVRALTRLLDSASAQEATLRLALVGPSAVPALAKLSTANSWKTRYWAVAALGKIDGDWAPLAVRKYWHDPDWRVRISALLALREDRDGSAYRDNEVQAELNPKVRKVLAAIESDQEMPEARRIVQAFAPSDDRMRWLANDYSIGYVRLGTPSHGLLLALHNRGVIADNRVGSMHLFWTVSGKLHDQELDLPPHWELEPSQASWRCHTWSSQNATTLEIVLDDPNSGSAEHSVPVFYQRVGTHWKRTNRDVEPFRFSNRGGFHLTSDHKHLSVWDLDVSEDSLLWGAHHYWLRTFQWSNGRFRRTSLRRTRRTYRVEANTKADRPVPASRDPLREFGRRWTYWQSE